MSTPQLAPAPQPPCNNACPAGVNVQAYVGWIAEGRYHEAWKEIRRVLPFPGICGRVCPAPCESACPREEHGGAIAIRALKRFVADLAEAEQLPCWPVPEISQPDRLAVVGSGPAGLTAALQLRRQGYEVEIFEASDQIGGLLARGIPAFRLPPEVVLAEVQAIVDSDVAVHTGVAIGRDLPLSELFARGFAAVLVAVGAHEPIPLTVPGAEGEGVVDALEFLIQGLAPPAKGRAIVIGGGSTAIDAARTALRRGCREVRIVYRRTRAEMPAAEEEIEHAIQEGVILQTQLAPDRVLRRKGKLYALRCLETRQGEPDASGRRRPEPVPGSERKVEADWIITAIGQRTPRWVWSESERIVDERGWVRLDREALQTVDERVFVAGDAVGGPATIIEAVADGRRAAEAIHRFLRTGSAEGDGAPEPGGIQQLEGPPPAPLPRVTLPVQEVERRAAHFGEVEGALSEPEARREAQRCLRCGTCSVCGHCAPSCPWRHAAHAADEVVRADRALFAPDVAGAEIELAADELVTSMVCVVEDPVCRGCGTCREVCAYDAPVLTDGKAAIDPAFCRGCGLCVAECPSGAIEGGPFDDRAIAARLERLPGGASVLFRCRWSGDPPLATDAVFTVPCAGRVSAGLVAGALVRGASRVTVHGCGDESCRFGRNGDRVRDRLGWLLERDPERLSLSFGGAS